VLRDRAKNAENGVRVLDAVGEGEVVSWF